MDYYFYIDETGDHGLSFVDKNFPLFLLCGCLFREDHLHAIEEEIQAFKLKYFRTREVILHSRDIRKCEGPFQILFNLALKQAFYADINRLLGSGEYLVFGSGVQKEEHIKKYGKGANDPYNIALSFMIERLIFCLDTLDKNARVHIQVEERGKKEDGELISHYNTIMDRGTYFIASDRLKAKIAGFKFYNKRSNIIGLQIADLIAYPLARYILNPQEPYIPFAVVKHKLYCNKEKEFEGWGLKVFP